MFLSEDLYYLNESPRGLCGINVTASALSHLLPRHLTLVLSELKGAVNHNSVTREPCKAALLPFLTFSIRNFISLTTFFKRIIFSHRMFTFYFHTCKWKSYGCPPPQNKQGCCQWSGLSIVPTEFTKLRVMVTSFSLWTLSPLKYH